jgi:3-isopropylmalate dehydratase small subunit
MEKFTTLTGVAAPMNMINIDTDKIIPKQYLKTIERTGLGKALFSEGHCGRRKFWLRVIPRTCAMGPA